MDKNRTQSNPGRVQRNKAEIGKKINVSDVKNLMIRLEMNHEHQKQIIQEWYDMAKETVEALEYLRNIIEEMDADEEKK